ncbi:MAG: gluconate 2-dehydrogenase subunit 3 family protein [Flavisolibacter sp.]|nr:gluconate 2-dehydrogenase subunit 3 family protein [Flavisolibacter sp.]
MERREAVKYISILLGGTVIGANAFITGCKTKTGAIQEWSSNDIAYLDEIAETILPRTSTPGAKDAKVGQFMTVMVNDCYEESDQKVFRDGMNKLNDLADKTYNASFLKLTPQQRHDLLVTLDKEAKDYQKKVDDFNKAEDTRERDEIQKGNVKYVRQHMSPHYFFIMKQLTMLGYFTSKIGMTQALRYEPVPGRYDGCVPYKKGEKAWA